jgi:hypothetical protein
VKDDPNNQGKDRRVPTTKDAKLAAALRANLARRKIAARPPASMDPGAADKDEDR